MHAFMYHAEKKNARLASYLFISKIFGQLQDTERIANNNRTLPPDFSSFAAFFLLSNRE
jgi:hypothetical protein